MFFFSLYSKIYLNSLYCTKLAYNPITVGNTQLNTAMKEYMKRVKHSSGFTMIELMVVIAIIAITAALVTPQMGPMIKNYYLRSATLSLVSELQSLKLRALKENEEAKLVVLQENGVWKCRSFLDLDDDNSIDAGEQINEIVFDDSVSVKTFNFNGGAAGFTSRGMPSNSAGTITLESSGGGPDLNIVVNLVGNIRTN